MTARRHHYVPQCYLKSFGVQRKAGKYQVNVFDLITKRTYEASTEKIALKRDFNTIDVEGHPSDAFETLLSGIEGDVAPALIRTIELSSFATEDDRNLLMNLMGILAVRNPRLREVTRQFHEEIIHRVLNISLSSKQIWESQMTSDDPKRFSYEEMKEFYAERKFKIDLTNGYHIHAELKMLEPILPALSKRGWMILRSSKESGGFIYSDHPVNLMWSNPKNRNSPYAPGFGMMNTQVLFPISNRLALMGAFKIKDQTLDINDDMVASINGAILSTCSRQVYARDLHFHYKLEPNEQPRKASRLIADQRLARDPRSDE